MQRPPKRHRTRPSPATSRTVATAARTTPPVAASASTLPKPSLPVIRLPPRPSSKNGPPIPKLRCSSPSSVPCKPSLQEDVTASSPNRRIWIMRWPPKSFSSSRPWRRSSSAIHRGHPLVRPIHYGYLPGKRSSATTARSSIREKDVENIVGLIDALISGYRFRDIEECNGSALSSSSLPVSGRTTRSTHASRTLDVFYLGVPA